MPKEKDMTKMIPRIYKNNAENLGLFFFVRGCMAVVPTVKLDQAIYAYFKFISVENWDIESARSTYTRLNNEYIDFIYNKK